MLYIYDILHFHFTVNSVSGTYCYILWLNIFLSSLWPSISINTLFAKVFLTCAAIKIIALDIYVFETFVTFNCNGVLIWVFIQPNHLMSFKTIAIIHVCYCLVLCCLTLNSFGDREAWWFLILRVIAWIFRAIGWIFRKTLCIFRTIAWRRVSFTSFSKYTEYITDNEEDKTIISTTFWFFIRV